MYRQPPRSGKTAGILDCVGIETAGIAAPARPAGDGHIHFLFLSYSGCPYIYYGIIWYIYIKYIKAEKSKN